MDGWTIVAGPSNLLAPTVVPAPRLPSEDLLELIEPNNILPTSTFQFFERLPSELRGIIWSRCVEIDGSRNVHATLMKPSSQWNTTRVVSKTNNPTPIVLRICPESRMYGLEEYTIVFKTMSRFGIKQEAIYANPALDTIVFHLPGWMQQCCPNTTHFKMRLQYPPGLSSMDFSTARPLSNATHTMSKMQTTALIHHPFEHRNFLVVHPRSEPAWTPSTIGLGLVMYLRREMQVPACWDGFWTAFAYGLEDVLPHTPCSPACTGAGCVVSRWVADYDHRFWKF